LESKSQDQNSSRKTDTTEKDCSELEKHNNNNNKVANALENKEAGSFPLSWFVFLPPFPPRAVEEEKKNRKRQTRGSSSPRERERERESEIIGRAHD
jgi:hypothetical protein